MHPLEAILKTITIIVGGFLVVDTFNYAVYHSRAGGLVWLRRICWPMVRKRIIKINHHDELIHVLAPDLIKDLDVFVQSPAAKVLYHNQGYLAVKDFMVLMIDSYYSNCKTKNQKV